MRKVSIAVVDDDARDVAATKEMIRRYCAGDHGGDNRRYTVETFTDGTSLLAAYDVPGRKPFDVMFLDVEMPGIDGLQTARILRTRDTRVVLVFTTKMAQYATIGYDVDAIGYLVKPLQYPGFALTMRKAMRIINTRGGTTIAISSDDHIHFLDSDDVRYVEVVGHSVLYHTDNGVWRNWGTLKAAAEKLEPHHFVASSRYCLVNLEWVSAIDGTIVTVDGQHLTVSRSRKKPLLEALSRYHAGGSDDRFSYRST